MSVTDVLGASSSRETATTSAGSAAPQTVAEALLAQAAQRGSRAAFTVVDLDGRSRTLSYAELLAGSLRAAAVLRERGLRQGERVLICLGTSPELLLAIYGTMLAGGVCVPLYPPQAAFGLRRWKEQALAIARVAQPRGAVVAPAARLHMAAVLEQVGRELFALTSGELQTRGAGLEQPPLAQPEQDLAFIQFTSGTTRQPRGVSVTHAALLANMRGLLAVMPLTPADISVSWLPPYHDMGLVGHIFVPVLGAVHQYLLPPAVLQRRPARWLQLCSATHATQTTAPNFAYAIGAQRLTRSERAGLDLGALRFALSGAETVQAETLQAFVHSFAASGFDPAALRPVYGLAETTLAATFGREGGAHVDHVDRGRLAACAEALPCPADDPRAQAFVAVGHPLPGHELEIVRDDGRPCGPRLVGEIRLRGPSVMSGYFNNPQATREVLRQGWLWTGDLGYLDERGALHVTGRRKELIIKGGRNYLPHDFEAACLDVPALRPGRAVAFGLGNARSGTEDVVLVAEVRDAARTRDPVLLERVARAVLERTGLRPDRIELADPGALPRTTSGKLQRTRVKAAYEAGIVLRAPPISAGDAVVEGVRSAIDLARVKIARILGWQ